MTASSPPPSHEENYYRKLNMFKQKTAAVVKDPNSAVMDGPDKEGKEGDDNGVYGADDPPPISSPAAISEEECFPMILSTESTNSREERSQFQVPTKFHR